MIRALLFDLDGTAIPNRPDGMPSQRMLEEVQLAQKKVMVACATGRELSIARPIIEAFQLTAPCIVAGGSRLLIRKHGSLFGRKW